MGREGQIGCVNVSVAFSVQFSPSVASGSSVPRILQARVLEWVAISFSNA